MKGEQLLNSRAAARRLKQLRQEDREYRTVHPPAVIFAQQITYKALQVHHSFVPARVGIGRKRDHDTFPGQRSVTPSEKLRFDSHQVTPFRFFDRVGRRIFGGRVGDTL